MSLFSSILVALFCMSVVFAVLAMLWGLIRLFSAMIRIIERKNEDKSV